ncbi:MAG TPA: hypothetical protein VLF40_02470 [Candidatus Saccharimonadales bacterium]|nr:hypothetical protein [Candidatus Saccharimonadales bacterium]
MNARLSSLMDKELSRKEFLGLSGLAVASIFGFGTAIKLLTGKSLHSHPSFRAAMPQGYGSSAYGGFKDSH